MEAPDDDAASRTASPGRRRRSSRIVGRPNVGKSTLFNRLVGRKVAIVHDEPGVTRDRHYADVTSRGRRYTLVDTGGFDPESDDPMRQGIRRQVEVAIAEADVIVFVLDAAGRGDGRRSRGGRAPPARGQARHLRRQQGRLARAATPRRPSSTASASSTCIPVSALHGRGIDELEAAIAVRAARAAAPAPEPAPDDGRAVRIAIVGRPNAGKSSLVNRLAGEERMLVDDAPGHDARRDRHARRARREALRLHRHRGHPPQGQGRRRSEDVVEAVSVLHAIRAMERCEVVAAHVRRDRGRRRAGREDPRPRRRSRARHRHRAQQDRPARQEAIAEGRGGRARQALVRAVRADRAREREDGPRRRRALRRRSTASPTRSASASTTGELNRFFEQVLETHPPPTRGGNAPRASTTSRRPRRRPPLFVVMTNDPDTLHFSYRRYVANQLRKAFGFEGVPVRVKYKEKRRRER